MKEYFRLSLKSANRKKTLKYLYSWVVKIRNTSEAVLRLQYNCGPHTVSSVFLILKGTNTHHNGHLGKKCSN